MHYHELVFSAGATQVLKKAYSQLLHKLNLGKTLDPNYLAALTLRMRELLYEQEALTAFWQAAEATPGSTHHLHLIHRDKEILNLPWQMAVDENNHPSVFISKGLTRRDSSPAYLPQAAPLKILVMISSPEDGYAGKRLSYEKEEEALLEAVKPLYEKQQVQVSFTLTGSLKELETKLAEEHFHLLYFSGHSTYKHQSGYLLLEDEETLEGEEVPANEFAAAICKHREHIPALVVLASCQSAEGNVEEGFPGVADELLTAGVPSVIAMAFSIPDWGVRVFAANLFEALGRQELLLPAYVHALHALETAEADYAIEQDYDLAPTQWLIPQLYCNQSVQHIVQWSGGETKGQTKQASWIAGSSEYRFIGRRHELSHLLPLLHQRKPVLLIGRQGVGKTALAEKAVQRLLAADSHWIPFRFEARKMSMDAIKTRLKEFIATHALTPITDEDNEMAMLEAVRRQYRPIWIVDGIDAVQTYPGGPLQDEHKAWMSWLQQYAAPSDPVVFMARYAVPELAFAQTLPVNEASPEDIFIHLHQLNAGAILTDQEGAEPLQIAEILYNALGGNYKAWYCFDKLYKKHGSTLSKTIEKIRRTKDPSKTRHLYEKITSDVQEQLDAAGASADLAKIQRLLDHTDWQVLQLLAHFRTPVPVKALQLQDATIEWQTVLTKLHGLSLIEKSEPFDEEEGPRFDITRLVKVWLTPQRMPEPSFSGLRAGDYYQAAGEEDDHLPDYIEAFWHYLPLQPVEQINKTGQWLMRAYYDGGMYEEARNYGLHVLQVCGEATHPEVLNIMGAVSKQLGRMAEAVEYWMAFHEAAIHTGNRVEEGLALNNLAAASHELAQYEDAIVMMEAAIVIARETNDLRQLAAELNSLGKIVEELPDLTRAQALYEESLQLRREMNDRKGEAHTLLNLADAYVHLGEVDKASQALQFCITVFREEAEVDMEATAYEKLGELYEHGGAHEQAMDYMFKALQLYRSLRNRIEEARVWDIIGQLYTATGDYDYALASLTKSLEMNRQTGLKQKEATTLMHLSELYRAKGEPEKGVSYVKEAIVLFKELEDETGEAESLFQLGRLYGEKGNTEMSHRYFKQSKKLLDTLGPAARQDILDAIDHQLLPPEDTAKRLAILQKNLADCRKKGNRLYEADLLYQMAEIALEAEQVEEFFEWVDEAYDIYTELVHYAGIFRAGFLLGHVLYQSEDAADRAEGLELLQLCFQIGQANGYPETQELAAFIKSGGA